MRCRLPLKRRNVDAAEDVAVIAEVVVATADAASKAAADAAVDPSECERGFMNLWPLTLMRKLNKEMGGQFITEL